MPTIKQLPSATSVSATDVLPVSQGGVTRGLSVGNLLSSTQAAIAIAPGKLLGRASATSGGPESMNVGAGLTVASGTLAATGADHTGFPVASVLTSGDEVVVNSGGAAKRMPAVMLRGLFSAGSNVSIDAAGTISAGAGQGTVATQSQVGAVKPGSGLAVATDGTLNVQFGAGSAVSFEDSRIVMAEPLAVGDLRRFGWVGDGRDETAVFQAALAAIPHGGGHIVIPDSPTGTTLGQITIDRSVTIRGEGGPSGQTALRPLSTTTTMFTVAAEFVTFDNLLFSPADPTTSKQTAGSYIMVASGAARFRALRLTMNEFHEGITIAANVPTVELNNLFGFLYSTGLSQSAAFLHFQGGLDVRVSGVTANGPGTGTTDVLAGVWIESLGDGVFSNCDIISMGTDLLVNPGTGQGVTSLWVCDSFLDTADRGALFTTRGFGQIARCRLSNVWASSQRLEGIRVEGAVDGLDIDNPHLFLNGLDGVAFAGGKNLRLRGGQVAQNLGSGVHVSPGISDWSVEGVTIGATGGLTANTGWGVRVEAGASDRYRISGNSLSGNTGGSVQDGGTGTHKTVWNNTGSEVDYRAYRDPASGLLTFVGQQAGSSGFVFATDDGTERFRITRDGAKVNGVAVTTATDVSTAISSAIQGLVNSAPGTLDTLGEIATQLASDESAAAALTTSVAGKLSRAANLSDIGSAAAARANLGLAAVAASGAFGDLTGRPTIATSATAGLVKADGTSVSVAADGTLSVSGQAAAAFSGAIPAGALALITVAGTAYTATQSQMQSWAGTVATATGATIAGAPGTATVAVAITGVTCTLTPSGATGYASITVGGTEQTPRAAFTGTSVPSLTAASAGTATIAIYAAASGGSALATSGSITVSAAAATSGTIGVPTGTPTMGQASSFSVTANAYPVWASISQGGAEQTPRTQVNAAGAASMTPTVAGSSTASLYAAATGGSAIATTGASFTVAVGQAITVANITAPAASTTFTVSGTYANGTPTALDYSTNGGTSWVAAASPTISGGSYSLSITGGLSAGTYTVKVRDHTNTGVVGTSNSFTIAAALPAYTVSVSQYDAGPPASGSFGGGASAIPNSSFKLWVKDGTGHAPTGTIRAVYTRSNTVTPVSGVDDGTGYFGSNTGGAEVSTPAVFNDSSYPGLVAFNGQGVYKKGANAGIGNYYLWVSPDNMATWYCFNQALAMSA